MSLIENLINHDSPYGANDVLDRELLVDRVRHFIQKSNLDDEGITVSIEAPWGDGKSWMLSRIKAAFAGNPNYQTIAFSPWLVGSHEKLTLDFLNTLYTAFQRQDKLEKAALAVAAYISGLQNTVDKLAIGVYVGKTDPLIIWLAKPLISFSGWLVRKYKRSETLSALYERIRDGLSSPATPKTVILIDDIDRLQPAEVAEVIRLIQSVGRLPNVVYVLAIEPNYVIEALKHTGLSNAQQYLDKIIQLRITLPRQRYSQLQQVIEAELTRAANSSLFTAFEANGYSLQADWQRYLRPLIGVINNLRDWKRVWNRFRFAEQGIRGQVNPVELLVLSAIAIKTPTLYAKIISHPHLFAHDVNNYDSHKVPSATDAMSLAIAAASKRTTPQEDSINQEQKYQQLQTELGLGDGHLVWRLVDSLFPMLRHPTYASRPDRATGKLEIYTNLRLALSGDSLNEQLSNTELGAVLFETNGRSALFEKIKHNRYLWDDLLYELDKQRNQSHQFKEPAELLAMLAKLDLRHEYHGFRISGVDGFIRQWLDNLLNQSTNEAARQFVESVVTTLATSYSGNVVLARTLREICSDEKELQSHYYENLRKIPTNEQKQAWSNAYGEWCIDELDKGTLENQPQAQVLFWCLVHINKLHFSSISLTQERFSAWCDVMCSSPSGSSNTIRYHSISGETIEALGGIAKLKDFIALLPSEPEEMISWKAALANPNKKYQVGTSREVTRYF